MDCEQQSKVRDRQKCLSLKFYERKICMLEGKVKISKQECEGNYKFTGVEQYMTSGFQNAFGEEATLIAFTALALILKEYPNNADYLQTFEYEYPNKKVISFWCIHDETYITFLLPEEY